MLSKEVKVSISSLNFKFMDMKKISASFNNQWPLDWFRTRIYNKGKVINNILRNVKGGGIHAIILIVLCFM
jgi:hypothetical protein